MQWLFSSPDVVSFSAVEELIGSTDSGVHSVIQYVNYTEEWSFQSLPEMIWEKAKHKIWLNANRERESTPFRHFGPSLYQFMQ